MATVDVSELLSDPDFVDKISLITRVPRINDFGENTTDDVSLDSIGCVQPAQYREVQRIPEALRVANLMTFWFKGVIIASAPGKYPSILVFKGLRYQVHTVADWSSWGSGYTEGSCVAEVPA